jgi:hypothetical protein
MNVGMLNKKCEHGRKRSSCKDCGGSGVSEHGRDVAAGARIVAAAAALRKKGRDVWQRMDVRKLQNVITKPRSSFQ